MRTIKFRAWDTSDKEKGAYMLGPYDLSDAIFAHTAIRKMELMQYTGMNDKENKEIYEGDIVSVLHSGYSHWTNEKFRVYYCEESAKFKITNDKSYPHDINDEMSYKYFKIIGNVHQTPQTK